MVIKKNKIIRLYMMDDKMNQIDLFVYLFSKMKKVHNRFVCYH